MKTIIWTRNTALCPFKSCVSLAVFAPAGKRSEYKGDGCAGEG